MFLHLGNDVVIPLKDIIAIIDAKSVNSKYTKEFIKICDEEGFIENVTDDNIKSYIITEKIEKDSKSRDDVRVSIIYGSNISSTTLLKRSNINSLY